MSVRKLDTSKPIELADQPNTAIAILGGYTDLRIDVAKAWFTFDVETWSFQGTFRIYRVMYVIPDRRWAVQLAPRSIKDGARDSIPKSFHDVLPGTYAEILCSVISPEDLATIMAQSMKHGAS